MSITDAFPMRKRRSVDKTPGRTTNNTNGGRSTQCTPRRITSNNTFLEQGLEIIWDNNSPSPTRTLHLGKRKKQTAGSDSSSSGGEISDLVKRLADKTGQTPEGNSLLNYWMQREDQPIVEGKAVPGKASKKKTFQTPASRRPRRGLRRGNRANVKQLTKELELLASQIQPGTDAETDKNAKTPTSTSKGKTTDGPLSARQFDHSIPAIQRKPLNTLPNGSTITSTSTRQPGLIPGNRLEVSPVRLAADVDAFDWDDGDEDDIILSQVDISALCGVETQVFSNTQMLDSGSHTEFTAGNSRTDLDSPNGENIGGLDDSLVTESWDFTDDLGDEDSILLSTLQEVEQSQRVKPTTPTMQQNHTINLRDKEDTREIQNRTPKYSTETIVQDIKTATTSKSLRSGNNTDYRNQMEHSKDAEKSNGLSKDNPEYSKPDTVVPATSISGSQSSQRKYSKEDIKRKKLEAQQKRKMRQGSSQIAQNNPLRKRRV